MTKYLTKNIGGRKNRGLVDTGGMKPVNLCIVSLHSREIEHYSNQTAHNKIQYAVKNGYGVAIIQGIPNERNAAWSKIPFIKDVLPNFDWVFWSDADSVFMDFNIPLAKFIDVEYEMLITREPTEGTHRPLGQYNTGNFFLKNCVGAFEFLDQVYEMEGWKEFEHHEQDAVNRLITTGKIDLKVKTCPQRDFNSYAGEGFGEAWQEGDLVCHCAAGYKSRIPEFLSKVRTLPQQAPAQI